MNPRAGNFISPHDTIDPVVFVVLHFNEFNKTSDSKLGCQMLYMHFGVQKNIGRSFRNHSWAIEMAARVQ